MFDGGDRGYLKFRRYKILQSRDYVNQGWNSYMGEGLSKMARKLRRLLWMAPLLSPKGDRLCYAVCMLVCIPTEPARNEYDFFVHCYLWRQETPFSLALAMFLLFCRNIFTTTKHKMLAIFFNWLGCHSLILRVFIKLCILFSIVLM